jgi:hypothetical protein
MLGEANEHANQKREEDNRQHVALGGGGERVLGDQAFELFPKHDADASRLFGQQCATGSTFFE